MVDTPYDPGEQGGFQEESVFRGCELRWKMYDDAFRLFGLVYINLAHHFLPSTLGTTQDTRGDQCLQRHCRACLQSANSNH